MVMATLLDNVVRHFHEHVANFNLDPSSIRVRHILSEGGFTNYSFTVGDGATVYHVKLACEAHRVERLRQWFTLRSTLEHRYRAPEVVGWLDLTEISCSGMVFRHIDGVPADWNTSPVLLHHVLELIRELHRDRELASQVRQVSHGLPLEISHAESFIETYIERFYEDLDIVESTPPRIVSHQLLGWMHRETRHLEQVARERSAFAGTAEAPIHGDLHEHNILIGTQTGVDTSGQQHWFVLDWDDLTLGDPALDYVMLLWPLLSSGAYSSWHDCGVSAPPEDPHFDERMALYCRAQLLDGVIDTLADYVECEKLPLHEQARVKAQRQQQHQDSLQRYRTLYRECQ